MREDKKKGWKFAWLPRYVMLAMGVFFAGVALGEKIVVGKYLASL